MGGKKDSPDPKMSVTRYRMAVHMGVCQGPVDRVKRILIGEKLAWGYDPVRDRGDDPISESTILYVDREGLFGGEKKEGGVRGRISVLFGGAAQTLAGPLAGFLGRTTATAPGFRGLLSLWFYLDGGGFIWGWNTPYLKPVWIEVERVSCEWLPGYAAIVRNSEVTLNFEEKFNDGLGAYSVAAGSMDGFTIVSDDYGPALQVEPGAPGLDTIVRGIASAPLREMTVKFKVTAKGTDDYGRCQLLDAADNIVVDFIAGRQSSIDSLRRPNATFSEAIGAPGNPIGPGAVTTGRWYEMRAAYLDATGVFACSVVDLTTSEVFGSVEVAVGARSNISKVAFLTEDEATSGSTVIWDDLVLSRGEVTYDRNPAHIIYECLTNANWGMGYPAASLDLDSFEAAAIALFDEQFGLTMVWSQQTAIESFVGEVLDHIEAQLFLHPRTGLMTLKLIRGDYTVASLPTISPANATLSNFQRKSWGETVNEVIVSYTEHESGKAETVAAHDLASISIQGLVSDTRNYYGVRRRGLAARLANRDLRTAAAPLATCDAELDRTQWDLVPGDVVKLNWAEYGINQIVMRVGPVDYGAPGNSKIKVSLAEDVFGLDAGDFTDPPDSEWEDPSEDPTAIDHQEVLSLPYWSVVQVIGAGAAAAAVHPESGAGVLAAQGGSDTSQYELETLVTDASGAIGYQRVATRSTLARMELVDALDAEASTALTVAGQTQGALPETGGFAFIGAGGDEAVELALVTAFDDVTLAVTLDRGVLDTVPREWPALTPVWFLNANQPWHDPSERAAGETASYRIRPRTSLGLLPRADAPVIEFTVGERPHLPSRPADVKVNGTGWGEVDSIDTDPVTVTVAERNRLTEDSQVLGWTDATVTPETGQTWKVELLDPVDRSVIATVDGLTGTSTTIAHSVFAGHQVAILRVTAERDGFESLQGHEITVLVGGITADTDLYTADTDELTADHG